MFFSVLNDRPSSGKCKCEVKATSTLRFCFKTHSLCCVYHWRPHYSGILGPLKCSSLSLVWLWFALSHYSLIFFLCRILEKELYLFTPREPIEEIAQGSTYSLKIAEMFCQLLFLLQFHLCWAVDDPSARSEQRVRTFKQSQPQPRFVAEVIFHASAAARHGMAWPGWRAGPDASWLLSSLELSQVQHHPSAILCEHPRAARVLSLFRQRRGPRRLAHFHPAQRLKFTLLHLPASCLRQSLSCGSLRWIPAASSPTDAKYELLLVSVLNKNKKFRHIPALNDKLALTFSFYCCC